MQISDSGIQLGYRRFLSDSAPGALVLLSLMLWWYVPVYGEPLNTRFEQAQGDLPDIPTAVSLGVLASLLILATAFGLLVSALSWFVVGILDTRLERLLFDRRGVPVFRLFLGPTAMRWGLPSEPTNSTSWQDAAYRARLELSVRHPEAIAEMGYVEGAKVFSRNLALLAFLFALYQGFGLDRLALALGSGVLSLLLVALAALIAYFEHCQILAIETMLEPDVTHNLQ